jgi:hypothetical protein
MLFIAFLKTWPIENRYRQSLKHLSHMGEIFRPYSVKHFSWPSKIQILSAALPCGFVSSQALIISSRHLFADPLTSSNSKECGSIMSREEGEKEVG